MEGPSAEMMVVKVVDTRFGKRVSGAEGRVPFIICLAFVRSCYKAFEENE